MKNTRRLIIEVASGISDSEALEYVAAVIRQGKVSGESAKARRKQYCYITTFRDGVRVFCPERYHKLKSEKFVVWSE